MKYPPPSPLAVVFLLTIFCATNTSFGQNTLDNLGLGASTPSAVALSIRQLSSSYTGPVFRIRRSSDNELRDAYFDGSGTISLSSQVSAAGGGPATATTLGSWIGINSGTVAIWYDQSGFGRDASQPTFTLQPRIINAGVIDVVNGKPSLFTDGIDDQLTFTNSTSNNFSTFIVARPSATHQIDAESNSNTSGTSGQNYLLGATQSGTNGGQGLSVGTNGISNYEHGNSYMPPTAVYSGTVSGLSVIDVIYASKTPSVYLNSLLVRTGLTSPRPTVFASTQIGSGTYGAFNGNISEFVLFSSTLSSTDRQTVECNQSNFFIVPTITLGSISPLQLGSAITNLSYSATTGNPTTYSISWGAGALSAGFVNVTNAVLPATPIVIPIGGSAAAGATYTGLLTVSNTCGTSSISYNISLPILNSIVGLTPATSASYSLRRLSPTYTGFAIQVRRNSDNTTQDIGFTAGGDLDQAALLSFVGGGSGFVSIWYDQSGFGRNAVQATQARQPRIVNTGVVDTQNGRPTMIFSGGQTLLSSMTAAQGTTGGTITTSNFVFQNATVQSSLLSNADGGANRYNLHASWSDGSTYFDIGNIFAGGRISTPLVWPSYSIATFRRNGTQGDIWKNGVNSLSSGAFNSSVTSAASMWIGSYDGNQFFINGSLSELTVFPSALSNADRVALECSQSAYYTISLAAATNFEFYIQGTADASACNTTDENVVWKAADFRNVQGTGNSLVKINADGANGGWSGGAASWNTVSNNGYFQFTATETNTFRMAGLSNTNTDANWTSIQYAVYLRNDAQWEVRQSSSGTLFQAAYAANDVFKIAVEANVVKYYQNNVLRYISATTPTLPLLVDVSINSTGGTITNAIVSNLNTGSFTATALNPGASPTYDWYVGPIIPANLKQSGSSNLYTNTSLANNEVVTCLITYSGVCGTTLATSNSITNKAVAAPTSIDFYITGTTAASACNTVDENVAWKITDFRNVQGTGNSLVKINVDGANGGWNGGAASWNTVSNNGYFQFTATETNTLRMAGLSTTNPDANWTSIQYAIYLRNDAQWEVRQSSSGTLFQAAYAANDVFKIAVEANVVKYYQNNVLRYISATAPTLPLLVDVSINTTGGTITNAIVSNYNTGTFTATATNA
ncbi:MAG: arabinofuranosidase catalytic domain-containing protein, partial [Cyclobacteriaceae bacterium]